MVVHLLPHSFLFLISTVTAKMVPPKSGPRTTLVRQNQSPGPFLSIKFGPGRTNFVRQKWSYKWKNGPTNEKNGPIWTTFAVQKRSYQDHFWHAKTVLPGPFLLIDMTIEVDNCISQKCMQHCHGKNDPTQNWFPGPLLSIKIGPPARFCPSNPVWVGPVLFVRNAPTHPKVVLPGSHVKTVL